MPGAAGDVRVSVAAPDLTPLAAHLQHETRDMVLTNEFSVPARIGEITLVNVTNVLLMTDAAAGAVVAPGAVVTRARARPLC